MKKIIKLKEKDLSILVEKIINEQSSPKPDPNAVKSMDELIKNIESGFCVPIFNQGNKTRLTCKDGTYHEIRHYRKFGQ